jgi:hypothetical protein
MDGIGTDWVGTDGVAVWSEAGGLCCMCVNGRAERGRRWVEIEEMGRVLGAVVGEGQVGFFGGGGCMR